MITFRATLGGTPPNYRPLRDIDKALEISLLPAADPLLASVFNPNLGGTPHSITVNGEITREDDPSYRKLINFRKEYDPASGEGITRGTIARQDGSTPPTVIYEVSQLVGTRLSAMGRVSNDGETDPPNAAFNQHFESPGMRIRANVGRYEVRAVMDIQEGHPTDQGEIICHEGPTPSSIQYKRTTFSFFGGDVSFHGEFGGLPEEGQATLRSNDTVLIERKVGPYKITEEVSREWLMPKQGSD